MSADPADRSRRRRSRYLAAPPKPASSSPEGGEAEPPLTYDPASMRARMRAALRRPSGAGAGSASGVEGEE